MKARAILLLCASVLANAYANDVKTITITNHFNKPIRWIVSVNSDVLPGLTKEFSLAPFEEIQTPVLDLKKQAYLSGADADRHIAFWGIEIANHQNLIHGYVSHGIAYSWTQNKITFCNPDDYLKHNHC
jgi:hypothetical protein